LAQKYHDIKRFSTLEALEIDQKRLCLIGFNWAMAAYLTYPETHTRSKYDRRFSRSVSVDAIEM
jgi:hypothetical protein